VITQTEVKDFKNMSSRPSDSVLTVTWCWARTMATSRIVNSSHI